jgi:NAD(P)-dependent dehydrogenase (short-subunit alcohol dehydrogenase family)
MTAPVIIVTGANSGIGKAACRLLTISGAEVVMVCRDASRGAVAQSQIARETGHEPGLLIADLSSQRSIREFNDAFRRRYSRLDVLINNAAAFAAELRRRTVTSEGFETILATNHLGPFLLTMLLLDLLRASAPSRVLNVSSEGLKMFPWLRLEFDDLSSQRRYSRTRAYYQSKLAHVMFTLELASRLRDQRVAANCVRVANVALDPARVREFPRYARWAYAIKRRFAITPERMAGAYVRLALDPSFASVTGKHFDENCREVSIPAGARDPVARRRLWEISEEMTRGGRHAGAAPQA